MNSTLRSLLFWMVLVVVGVLIWNVSTRFQQNDRSVTFSDFMSQVEAGQIARVVVTGQEIRGTTTSNETFRSYAPMQYEALYNQLLERNVVVDIEPDTASPWATLLYSWAPLLLIIGFWMLIT